MTGTKCTGICIRYDQGFVKGSPYKNRLLYCATCVVYVENTHARCPCCHVKLRPKPKPARDKRTSEGEKAFIHCDIALGEFQNSIKMLPKYFKIHGLGMGYLGTVNSYLQQAIFHLEDIRNFARQRPDYVNAKARKLSKLVKEYRKIMKNFLPEPVHNSNY